MKRLLSLMVLFVWIGGVGGCQSSSIIYVHNASAGIDLHASPTDATSVKLSIGYDRETFSYVPRFTNVKGQAEAMSVTAVSRVEIDGLNYFKFGHMFSTGEAAIDLAKNPSALRAMSAKVFNDTQPKPKGGGQ